MIIKIQSPKVILNNFFIIFCSYLIYLVCAASIIFYHNITLLNNKSDNKFIGIISVKGYMGETELAHRLQNAANKLGWNSFIFFYPQIMGAIPIINGPIYLINYLLSWLYQPLFNLAITHHVNVLPPHPRYMFINVPPAYLLNKDNNLDLMFDSLAYYDAYIDINYYSAKYSNFEWLRNILAKSGNHHAKFISSVVPVTVDDYQYCNPKKLLVFGGASDKLRSSTRYKKMFQLLAQDDLIDSYGPSWTWGYLEKAYLGLLPSDGVSIIEKLRSNCIGLVIHSEHHLEVGIPTTRIMEVITSGAVAIVDDHPFVHKYFKDNVLYFNHKLSSYEMSQQIKLHIEWIMQNKASAAAKSKQAFIILKQHFTTEQFLLKVYYSLKN